MDVDSFFGDPFNNVRRFKTVLRVSDVKNIWNNFIMFDLQKKSIRLSKYNIKIFKHCLK